MYSFVLVVYMTLTTPMYVGHFKDCATANDHVKKHYPKAEYTSCLHEEYINLPVTLIKVIKDE